MAKELGVTPNLVYIPSHIIAKYDKDIGDGLLGDKTHSMIFDNSKIKALVPKFNPQIFFNFGAKEIVSWYNKPEIQLVNENFNNLTDIIIKDYENN